MSAFGEQFDHDLWAAMVSVKETLKLDAVFIVCVRKSGLSEMETRVNSILSNGLRWRYVYDLVVKTVGLLKRDGSSSSKSDAGSFVPVKAQVLDQGGRRGVHIIVGREGAYLTVSGARKLAEDILAVASAIEITGGDNLEVPHVPKKDLPS